MSEDRLIHVNNITDSFAIKNFVLFESGSIPKDMSLEKPFIFNGLVFGICLKGNGRVKINFKDYDVSKGTIVTVLPNQIFNSVYQSDDFLIETLFLSLDFITKLPLPKDLNLILRIGQTPNIIISDKKMYDILESHSIIIKHYKQNEKLHREEILNGLIYALIMEIGSIYSENETKLSYKPFSRQEELTENFFHILSEYYKTERSVSFYADKLFLTPKYLSTMVKNVTGRSILSWINEIVIIEAKTILKTTSLTVLEISEKLNFPNPSFFIRFFKQYAGITPLKYRNS